MNKNCYKTIYSRNLGRIVVVSELARNVGKTRSQGSRGAWQRLLPLSWRVALVLGSLGILPAGAEIIADSDAVREHQPQVLLSSEGVPQVDIQAPTAAGVSVNEYTQQPQGRPHPHRRLGQRQPQLVQERRQRDRQPGQQQRPVAPARHP